MTQKLRPWCSRCGDVTACLHRPVADHQHWLALSRCQTQIRGNDIPEVAAAIQANRRAVR